MGCASFRKRHVHHLRRPLLRFLITHGAASRGLDICMASEPLDHYQPSFLQLRGAVFYTLIFCRWLWRIISSIGIVHLRERIPLSQPHRGRARHFAYMGRPTPGVYLASSPHHFPPLSRSTRCRISLFRYVSPCSRTTALEAPLSLLLRWTSRFRSQLLRVAPDLRIG